MKKKNSGSGISIFPILSFLFFPIVSLALALHEPSKEFILEFFSEPKAKFLKVYDDIKDPELKAFLGEHLPSIFWPSFACQIIEGKQKRVVFAGDPIVTAATDAELSCMGGFRILLGKNTKAKLVREQDKELGVQLETGSILISFNNRRSFHISENWGSLITSTPKSAKIIYFKKGSEKVAFLLDGEVHYKSRILKAPENPQQALLYFSQNGRKAYFSTDSSTSAVPEAMDSFKFMSMDGMGLLRLGDSLGFTAAPQPQEIFTGSSLQTELLLPSEPKLLQLVQDKNTLQYSFELSWGTVPGVVGDLPCELFFASDRALKNNLRKLKLVSRQYRVDQLRAGTYYWALNCEVNGKLTQSPIESLLVQDVVSLVRPLNNSSVKGGIVELAWMPFYDSPLYEVQLSPTQAFTSLSKMPVAGTSIKVKIPKGNYFWRVLAQTRNKAYLSAAPSTPFQLSVE